MYKKLVAIAVGLMFITGVGAGVDAGALLTRTAVATPSELDPLASFSVTFSPCLNFESVVFDFQGQQKTVPCEVPQTETLSGASQLQAQSSLLGTATTSFTAPAAAGTFTGTATAVPSPPALQGIRGPAAAPAALAGGNLVAQAACAPGVCATFQVTVRQASTTTLAPTTTAVGAVPPAPTTTGAAAAPSLPATGPSQNDNTATIAILLLVVGGALLLAARWRGGHTPS
jgi:LPXTG-motif cell wall-anchored protein